MILVVLLGSYFLSNAKRCITTLSTKVERQNYTCSHIHQLWSLRANYSTMSVAGAFSLI